MTDKPKRPKVAPNSFLWRRDTLVVYAPSGFSWLQSKFVPWVLR